MSYSQKLRDLGFSMRVDLPDVAALEAVKMLVDAGGLGSSFVVSVAHVKPGYRRIYLTDTSYARWVDWERGQQSANNQSQVGSG